MENLNDLKKEFENYKNKKKNQGNGARKTKEEILAKYFTPRADRETFRLLPTKPNKKLIQEAFFHVLDVNISGGKKRKAKIYCPAHNEPFVPKKDGNGENIIDQQGKPVMIPVKCSSCEKAKTILKKQDPSVKGIKKENLNPAQEKIFEKNKEIFMAANEFEAKKFHIVRGIDMGKPKDGIKFWRFKHNFKNQGVFDKLVPVLSEYIDANQTDFTDPEIGANLSIAVTDGQFSNITYRQVSAITLRGPIKLHEDPIISKQWLDDNISWRDVFLPKKAPNITPQEYLEMLINGTDPYWDDSDSQNKKWVFPGRPDLETKANTRSDNLDGVDNNFEHASDINNNNITINNVSDGNVGTFKDVGTDVGQEVKSTQAENTTPEPVVETNVVKTPEPEEESNDYDDLPF